MNGVPIESNKFKNRFRVKSSRLPGWDYSQTGYYYVTICTRGMHKYFGEVVEEKMVLSEIGKVAEKYIKEIPNHFPFVTVDSHIVMPNHVHVILYIDKGMFGNTGNAGRDVACNVSTKKEFQQLSGISPSIGSLSSIVRSYKSAVSKLVHEMNLNFSWQPRFYDHVIQNDKSLTKIRSYIDNNISKWIYDDYYL